jgi:Protein-arginine deiminase (PAD)
MNLEQLESRRLMNVDPPRVDLRVDADRDGIITTLDDRDEKVWRRARGALVLPNLDRDGTASPAPDNWVGGHWNGSYVGPNNVIDNAADLRDMTRLRFARLVNTDASYRYIVTLKVLKPATDSAYYANVPAQDRVRVFMPTAVASGNRLVPQSGDQAVIGPGTTDEIRFIFEPRQNNEFPLSLVQGDGHIEFAVEGLRPGAGVRFELTVFYEPVTTFTVAGGTSGDVQTQDDVDPLPDLSVTMKDVVEMRVAPLVLQGNRDRVSTRAGSAYIEQPIVGETNRNFQDTFKRLFGDASLESDTADIWMQDGVEIGYARSPQGSMNLVLELPRANIAYREGGQRKWIRENLLKPGVGICTDVGGIPDDASAYGGDIETLPDPQNPSGPPLLLRSRSMPDVLKNFFDAQGVNRAVDFDLDAWLGVGHVDEVAMLNGRGDRVFTPDIELGWAMLLWARSLRGGATMLHGFDQSGEGRDVVGTRVADILANERIYLFNFRGINAPAHLPTVHRTLREQFGLTPEVSTPTPGTGNTGVSALQRGGVFSQLIRNQKRYVEVKMLDTDRYELRTRVAGKTWSTPVEGRKSVDQAFPDLGVYVLRSQWSAGASAAGDVFRFETNPDASLIRIPNLYTSFAIYGDYTDTPPEQVEQAILESRGVSMFNNTVNSLVDGSTILTGETFGPKVNHDGTGRRDLLRDYVESSFRRNGFAEVVFVDCRNYTMSSGGVHCGTNVVRDVPIREWWI